jgi:hypothetical protein
VSYITPLTSIFLFSLARFDASYSHTYSLSRLFFFCYKKERIKEERKIEKEKI